MAEPSTGESSPDRDFDPSADMLVNDFDDERTMEEEEAMESSEEAQNELDDLHKEGDMPIEDLLSMYGYGDGNQVDHPGDTQSSSSEEILSNQDLTLDKDEIARDLLQMDDEQRVKEVPAHDLIDAVDASVLTSRLLRSAVSHHQSESESESDNAEYVPEEDDDWKKVIQVGSDYQAVIPDGLRRYDGAPAYENDDKLVWDPSEVANSDVDEYLRKFQQQLNSTAQGVHSIPVGSHVRDDEQALYMLLQCGYNIEEAMRRRRMQSVAATDTMSLWSEEECRSFENGLRTYGKDFHLIQHNKVRTRSVGELVQFYYLWKKTERHDVFANKARLEKKKYTLHPGTTDYMDRFLDEQENPTQQLQQQHQQHRDRSSSPNIHSLISGDHKRHHHQQQQQHHSRSSPVNLSKSDEMTGGCSSYRPRLAVAPSLQQPSSNISISSSSQAATSSCPHASASLRITGNEQVTSHPRTHRMLMQHEGSSPPLPPPPPTALHHHHHHHYHHNNHPHQLMDDLSRNNFGNCTTKLALAASGSDAVAASAASNGIASTVTNNNGIVVAGNNNNNNNNDDDDDSGGHGETPATFKTLEMSISAVASHDGVVSSSGGGGGERRHHVATSSSVTSHMNSAVQ